MVRAMKQTLGLALFINICTYKYIPSKTGPTQRQQWEVQMSDATTPTFCVDACLYVYACTSSNGKLYGVFLCIFGFVNVCFVLFYVGVL